MEVRTRKKDWALTAEAFDALLASLDAEDRDRAGEKYERVRRKLSEFFEAHGRRSPSDLADETINRVARKISEGERIQDILRYFYGVARLVLMEVYRGQDKHMLALDVVSPTLATAPEETEQDELLRADREQHLECFDECLKALSAESHKFIVEYYREEKGEKIKARKRQAEALGIPVNALRLRAFRIRAKLDKCVEVCLGRARAT